MRLADTLQYFISALQRGRTRAGHRNIRDIVTNVTLLRRDKQRGRGGRGRVFHTRVELSLGEPREKCFRGEFLERSNLQDSKKPRSITRLTTKDRSNSHNSLLSNPICPLQLFRRCRSAAAPEVLQQRCNLGHAVEVV